MMFRRERTESCRLFGGGAGMPSVMGLLEERERAARQRVEALQAELREARRSGSGS